MNHARGAQGAPDARDMTQTHSEGIGAGGTGAGDTGTTQDPERTFAPLPPPHGRAFAESWWGQAWLKALDDNALEARQVRAGRRLARGGAVGAISVRPGRITAVVRDGDGTQYRADVLVQELDEASWDRFLDMAAQRAGHVAALLAYDMPGALVEDAASAGVELLPGVGDLEAECGCGEWDHCAHTAALATQLGRVLDGDPFTLFLLRGRSAPRLLAELERRGTQEDREPDEAASGANGVPARDAYAMGAILPPLPEDPPLPGEAGPPPSYETEVPAPEGVDSSALEVLASGAAAEALALLTDAPAPARGDHPSPWGHPLPADAVRLAATRPPTAIARRLAEGTGRTPEQLALAVRAWGLGGAEALAVLEDENRLGPEESRRARAAVAAAWEEPDRPALREQGDRWTAQDPGVQIRGGLDGRWWPYRWEEGSWAPAGPSATDPGTAYALALTPGEGTAPDTAPQGCAEAG